MTPCLVAAALLAVAAAPAAALPAAARDTLPPSGPVHD